MDLFTQKKELIDTIARRKEQVFGGTCMRMENSKWRVIGSQE
jgi:hypothetical protein